jgi:maleate isomerase
MSNSDQPFGWRKRIGLLSPTVIETQAYDFYKVAPDGVSMCATTANIDHWDTDNFREYVLNPMVTAVQYLASRHVDYIVHTGMPVVTTRGPGFDEELVKLITDSTGIPATTSIRSAIHAIKHLGIKNLGVLTPYPQNIHQSALTYLKSSGINIAAEHTEDVVFKSLQDTPPKVFVAACQKLMAAAPQIDGFYIPCNQWTACDAVTMIEQECGVPVVTGSHADYWEAFRSVGIKDRIEGKGRLMLSLSNEATR